MNKAGRPRKSPYIYQQHGNYWAFLGRNDRRSLYTTDPGEAAEKFAGLLKSAIRTIQRGKTISDTKLIFLARSKVKHSQKTTYEHENNLRRVVMWLTLQGIVLPSGITKATVEAYKAHRNESVGPALINRELSSWLQMMRVSVELRQAKEECLKYFEFLKEPKPNPTRKVHTRESLSKFFDHIDPRYLALCKLVLGSAIRDDEARHIQPENLKTVKKNDKTYYQLIITPLKAGTCECHASGWNTKNYRYRTIPISIDTYISAVAFINSRQLHNLHRKSSQRMVWGAIQQACRDAGVEEFSLHDLRHTAASYWLDSGIKVATISNWLGHSSLEITQRYLHAINTDYTDVELPF